VSAFITDVAISFAFIHQVPNGRNAWHSLSLVGLQYVRASTSAVSPRYRDAWASPRRLQRVA